MLDALVDRQDRDVAGAGQAAGVDSHWRLRRTCGLRSLIAPDAVDEVGARQVQVAGVDRLRRCGRAVGRRLAEELLEPRRGQFGGGHGPDPPVIEYCRLAVARASWRRGAATGGATARARMEHRFTGPSYTLGIEEELMIVDARDARPRQRDRGACSDLEDTGAAGEVKPELMESVLEIATDAVRTTPPRPGRQLARAAPHGRQTAAGSAG